MEVITGQFEAIGWLFSLLEVDGRLDVIDVRFESPLLAVEVVEGRSAQAPRRCSVSRSGQGARE